MKSNRQKWIAEALVGLGVFLSWGIIGSEVSSKEAREIVKLHIPNYSPMSMPFQIATEKGFYKEEDIEVQTITIKTGTGVQALIAGSIDASQILGLTLRAAISRGAPLKIVMVFNDRPFQRLLAKKEIKSFAELKGKIVGSTSPGASADALFRRALEKYGLDPKTDLKIVYFGDSSAIWQALSRGTLDAAVMNPPYNVFAKEAGFRELAEFAGEIGALSAGVSVNERFPRDRFEVFKGFIRATWRGFKFFKTEREGSIQVMGKFMDVQTEMAAKLYDGSVESFTDSGFISEDFQRKVLTFEFGRADDVMMRNAFDFSVVKNR